MAKHDETITCSILLGLLFPGITKTCCQIFTSIYFQSVFMNKTVCIHATVFDYSLKWFYEYKKTLQKQTFYKLLLRAIVIDRFKPVKIQYYQKWIQYKLQQCSPLQLGQTHRLQRNGTSRSMWFVYIPTPNFTHCVCYTTGSDQATKFMRQILGLCCSRERCALVMF